MNRKIILLPLAAAALVLGACTPSTPADSSSSAEEPTSSPVDEPTSSTTSSTTPGPTLTYLEDVIGLEVGATYTARAYYMGKSPLIYEGNTDNYDSIYVADGELGYILYRTDVTLLEGLNVESWVAGETLLQWTGKVADYTPENSTNTIYESTVSAISVVESGNVEDPVVIELNADSAKLEVTTANQSRMVKITGAKVTGVTIGDDSNTTIAFTLGANEYSVYIDSRYSDVSEFAGIRVGDTLDFTTFTDIRRTFAYCLDLKITPDTTPAIEISGPTSVRVGEEITLTATTYNLGENPAIVWTADESGNASVDQTGKVTGVKEGEATITAAVDDVKATWAITVGAAERVEVARGRLGLYQPNVNKKLYATLAEASRYLATTEVYEEGAEIIVYKAATEGHALYINSGASAGKYLAADGNTFVFSDNEFAWTWDTTNSCYSYVSGSTTYYIGTYNDFETLSLSDIKYVSTSFPAAIHATAIVNPNVSIEAEVTSVNVGESINLTATVTDIEEPYTVVWSADESGNATVDETGKVLGVKEGKATITATVGDVSDSIEIDVLAAGLSSVTYTFKDYTAGEQYAENEQHILDENVTCTVNDGHFTTQIRLYDSNTHDSTAVFQSTKPIVGIQVRAGNKAATLIVSGSNDGTAYTTIENIATTSTYTDYKVTMPTDGSYTYIKFDADGDQIRLESVTFTFAAE